MLRYKITIEYDGTGFVGWQFQKNGLSIQEVIQNAIASFTNQKIELHAAGRTDAGVHALAQIAHFDLVENAATFDSHKIITATNHFLKPHNISIIACEITDDSFHARFNATERHYKYIILNRPAKPALDANKTWWIVKPLDVSAMNKAAQSFIGKHDFTAFRASECQAKSPIKSINTFTVIKEGHKIICAVSAKSFMHNQVRSMVGTLVEIGKAKTQQYNIDNILNSKDRSLCGPVAPPFGLYLIRVDY